MDIKYPIENEYMKYVLQINGFSGPRPRVRSNSLVESSQGARHLFWYIRAIGLGDSMN